MPAPTRATVAVGPDTTKTFTSPDLALAASGSSVALIASEVRASGRRLIVRLEMPRAQLLALLDAEPRRKPASVEEITAGVKRLRSEKSQDFVSARLAMQSGRRSGREAPLPLGIRAPAPGDLGLGIRDSGIGAPSRRAARRRGESS